MQESTFDHKRPTNPCPANVRQALSLQAGDRVRYLMSLMAEKCV